MFPIDPKQMTSAHPVERREALRRADHLRAVRGPKGGKPDRERRFGRTRRAIRRGKSRGALAGSPPGGGGRLLQL